MVPHAEDVSSDELPPLPELNIDDTSGSDESVGEPEPEILHPSLTLRTKEKPNPEALSLREELPGWHGYVEWEKYPERKKEVKEYMKKFDFPGVGTLLSNRKRKRDGFLLLIYNRLPNFSLCLFPKQTRFWRV